MEKTITMKAVEAYAQQPAQTPIAKFVLGRKSRNFVTKQVEEGKWDLKFESRTTDPLTDEVTVNVFWVKYNSIASPEWKKSFIEALEIGKEYTLKINTFKNKLGKSFYQWDFVYPSTKKEVNEWGAR